MFAEWLNSTFASFDFSILSFFHELAVQAGAFLSPIMNFISIIGDNGYFGFLIGFILLCFPKTRKCGACVIFAIGFGALFTNIAIKNIVARPRPYMSDVTEFKLWWEYVGAHIESEFSFPSGHTTAAMASMTALCIAIGKSRKWLIAPSVIYVILMGASRNYLMVHYPTDIIGALFTGTAGAVLSFFFVSAVWRFIEKSSSKPFCSFILNASIANLFSKKEKIDDQNNS